MEQRTRESLDRLRRAAIQMTKAIDMFLVAPVEGQITITAVCPVCGEMVSVSTPVSEVNVPTVKCSHGHVIVSP